MNINITEIGRFKSASGKEVNAIFQFKEFMQKRMSYLKKRRHFEPLNHFNYSAVHFLYFTLREIMI